MFCLHAEKGEVFPTPRFSYEFIKCLAIWAQVRKGITGDPEKLKQFIQKLYETGVSSKDDVSHQGRIQLRRVLRLILLDRTVALCVTCPTNWYEQFELRSWLVIFSKKIINEIDETKNYHDHASEDWGDRFYEDRLKVFASFNFHR